MKTPVALIVFNRPRTTERVFEEIAKARPPKLFVIADGPRPDHSQDVEKCAASREIIESVDWECEVFRNYSDVNLGCGVRPATGISWVFENVEKAIILEDDCVPHPTFFRFCEELLEMFCDDERVMHISGSNYHFRPTDTHFSYFFSIHNICHGWATWRRAWKHFDMGVKIWQELRDTNWLGFIVENTIATRYWYRMFDRAFKSDGKIDFWDYQWTFACWMQNGLSILPKNTLISNIGFGKDATHTKSSYDKRANLPTSEMVFPLEHPPFMVRDREADQFIIEDLVVRSLDKNISLYGKLRRKLSPYIPVPMRKKISKILSL